MALFLVSPVPYARLRFPLSGKVSPRKVSTLATTISTSWPDDKEEEEEVVVDWVKATSNFFEQGDSRPIMLFDGMRMRFEPLESESGKKLLQRSKRAPHDIASVVLVEKDRSYIKSEAVLKIMENLNLPFPQLALFLQFVPLFLRDSVYDNVANNRYNIFGRSVSCDI
ncbi:hypothetical protein MKX01_019006 [Papaver californicum]|nr:hypothetical protein MKX01_019006 [Papaver californicum]